MTAYVVNMPASAECGARTKFVEQLGLVDVNPQFRHANGLQPCPENIV